MERAGDYNGLFVMEGMGRRTWVENEDDGFLSEVISLKKNKQQQQKLPVYETGSILHNFNATKNKPPSNWEIKPFSELESGLKRWKDGKKLAPGKSGGLSQNRLQLLLSVIYWCFSLRRSPRIRSSHLLYECDACCFIPNSICDHVKGQYKHFYFYVFKLIY